MRIEEIATILKASILTELKKNADLSVIAAGSADIMNDVLYAVSKQALLLTGLIDESVVRTAKIAKIGAIVFVRGKIPKENAIRLANEYEIPLLVTEYSLFVASGRLYINGLRGIDGSW